MWPIISLFRILSSVSVTLIMWCPQAKAYDCMSPLEIVIFI